MFDKGKINYWHLLLILVVLIAILPILFMVSNSFKTLRDSYNTMLSLIPLRPTLNNYLMLNRQVNLLTLTWNTFLMAAIVTIGKLLTGLLTAYAFRSYRFKGKMFVYLIFVSTIFVPFTIIMIPNYLVIAKLNLLNNVLGVALPQLCDATGIMIFLKTMEKIPNTLIDAAKVDNIPNRKIFFNIVIPILKPSIVSVGAIFFINS